MLYLQDLVISHAIKWQVNQDMHIPIVYPNHTIPTHAYKPIFLTIWPSIRVDSQIGAAWIAISTEQYAG